MVVLAAVLAAVLLAGDDDQSHVEVSAGDSLPSMGSLNRSDDYGADVVRAYLQAVLTCTPAAQRLATQLSGAGDTTSSKVHADACARSGDRSGDTQLEAKIAREELDERGRSLWNVTGPAGAVGNDLVLRVSQDADGWVIERACRRLCLS